MPNARDYEGGKRRIFAIGIGGVGKTTMIRTLPGKTFAYLFDPNALESLQGADVEYELFNRIPVIDQGTAKHPGSNWPNPEPFEEFRKHFADDGYLDQFDNICLDSCTSFIDVVADYICFVNKAEYIVPFQTDKSKGNLYVDTQVKIMNVLASMARMDKNIYVTAHTQFKQEGENGPMKNVLMLIGQHQAKLPLIFTDVWRFFTETTKDGARFLIQTVPDQYNDYIRNTMHNLAPEVDVSIDDWANPQQYGFGKLLKIHEGEEG